MSLLTPCNLSDTGRIRALIDRMNESSGKMGLVYTYDVDCLRYRADAALDELVKLIDDAHRLLSVGCASGEEWRAVVKRLARNGSP